MAKLPTILSDSFHRLKSDLYRTGQPAETTFAFIRTTDGKIHRRVLKFRALHEKDQFVYSVWEAILTGKVTEVALIYEAWTKAIPGDTATQADIDRMHDHGVRNEPDKQEQWVLYYENKAGDKRYWTCAITREKPTRVVLGEPSLLPHEFIQPSRLSFFFEQAAEAKARMESMTGRQPNQDPPSSAE